MQQNDQEHYSSSQNKAGDSTATSAPSLLKRAFVFVVAIQCLETAFEVSTDDQSLTVPMSLPEIFTSATSKVTPPPQTEQVT